MLLVLEQALFNRRRANAEFTATELVHHLDAGRNCGAGAPRLVESPCSSRQQSRPRDRWTPGFIRRVDDLPKDMGWEELPSLLWRGTSSMAT